MKNNLDNINNKNLKDQEQTDLNYKLIYIYYFY